MPLSFNFVLTVAIGTCVGIAGVLTVGLLVVARLLPRGSRTADRLRQLASQIPRFALTALLLIPTLAYVTAIAFFSVV